MKRNWVPLHSQQSFSPGEEVCIAFGPQFIPLSSGEKEKMSPKFPDSSAILVYDSRCVFLFLFLLLLLFILPRRNMQEELHICRKRYVNGVDPKLNYLFPTPKQRSHTRILVIWFWIKWSKDLRFGGKLAVGCISRWQPLSICSPWLSAFTELHEGLLEKAKPAHISTELICIKESTYWINHRPQQVEFTCFSFPFNFLKCLHIHSSSGLPGDPMTYYQLYLENKGTEAGCGCVAWF